MSKRLKTRTLPRRYEPGCLDKLDRRTELAQRLRRSYVAIVEDLGGEGELSHVKGALIERFVFLATVVSDVEAQIAEAKSEGSDEADKLISRWIQAVNALTGLAKTLGVERKLPTLDLKAYIAK